MLPASFGTLCNLQEPLAWAGARSEHACSLCTPMQCDGTFSTYHYSNQRWARQVNPSLDNPPQVRYTSLGRARWGASGALYPKSATAGSNSLSRSGCLGLPWQSGVEDRVLRGGGVPNPARSGRKQRLALTSGCRRATWLELAGPGKLLSRVEGGCTASYYFLIYSQNLQAGAP